MNVISKKILRSSVSDSKGFAKDEEVAKINKIVRNFHLDVDDNDTEELLLVVPEELINKELLDLKQECLGEDQAKEKETAGEEKEKKKTKIHNEGFRRSLCKPQQAP